MNLSDRHLKMRIEAGEVVIRPFDPECVQPSTYDVHLSDEFRVFDVHELKFIDLREKLSLTRLVKADLEQGFVLHPGEFVLGSTLEYFELPDDLSAKLEGVSSLGRMGLVIHATAGFIDPGFKGQITFEMSNMNKVPMVLYPKMRIGQICYVLMSSPVDRPYGTAGNKYQGQMGPTESKVWKDFK